MYRPRPHVGSKCPTSTCRCVQDNSDVARPIPTSIDWCAYDTTNDYGPCLTSSEWCPEVMTDADVHKQCRMANITYSFLFADVAYPKHTFLGWCCRLLANIAFLKRTGLSRCCVTLFDSNVSQPMRTCHDRCRQSMPICHEWCLQGFAFSACRWPLSLGQYMQAIS